MSDRFSSRLSGGDYGRLLDSGKNSPYRRGTVIERDPAKGRVRVRFDDEQGDESGWIHVCQPGTGANKFYRMPDEASQVVCLMDWDGEDGAVLGAIWSDQDGTPTGDAALYHMAFAGGLVISVDQEQSGIRIEGATTVHVQANAVRLEAPVTIAGNLTVTGGIYAGTGVFSPVGTWPPVPVFVAPNGDLSGD